MYLIVNLLSHKSAIMMLNEVYLSNQIRRRSVIVARVEMVTLRRELRALGFTRHPTTNTRRDQTLRS